MVIYRHARVPAAHDDAVRQHLQTVEPGQRQLLTGCRPHDRAVGLEAALRHAAPALLSRRILTGKAVTDLSGALARRM